MTLDHNTQELLNFYEDFGFESKEEMVAVAVAYLFNERAFQTTEQLSEDADFEEWVRLMI